jgi:phosphoribosylaminoimidazole (AIR) synthetase
MTPTRIYVRTLLPLLQKGKILGAAHITGISFFTPPFRLSFEKFLKFSSLIQGGGLIENIPRVLPDHLCVQLMAHSWTIPPVFKWIAKEGNVLR